MRSTWCIPSSVGWATGKPHTRVFVTHKSGKEEIVEIVDDVGLNHGSPKEAMKRLRKQGLNPESVRFFDEPLKKNASPSGKSSLTYRSTFSLSHDPLEGEQTPSPSPTAKGSQNHKSNVVFSDDPVEVTAPPTSNSATYKTTFQLG